MTRPDFDFTLGNLLSLVWASVQRPRAVIRGIIDLELPAPVLWEALAALIAISVVLGQIVALLVLPQVRTIDQIFLNNPMVMAAIQGFVLVITVLAIHWIGGAMGGQGRFEGALTIMAWLQFMMIFVEIAQGALVLVLPGLAGVITLAGLALFLWLFTCFVAELHRFQNLALVFVMILVSALGLSFALTLVLSLLGITFNGGAGV